MFQEEELGSSEPTVESRPPSGSISRPFYHPLKATDIRMQFELQVKEAAEFDRRITALEEIQRELIKTVNRLLAIKEDKDATLQKILTVQQELMAMMLMQEAPPQPPSAGTAHGGQRHRTTLSTAHINDIRLDDCVRFFCVLVDFINTLC